MCKFDSPDYYYEMQMYSNMRRENFTGEFSRQKCHKFRKINSSDLLLAITDFHQTLLLAYRLGTI